MTALQVIIKEAKAIRKKSPKIEWKKAVAQASAIYASKHKGKSPVGKKKAVKKAAKNKYVGSVKKKAAKKVVRKKPTEKTVLKTIKKAVSVQKAHMSGIGKNFKKYIQYKKHIIDVTENANGKKMYFASTNKLAPAFVTDQLNIAKKFIDRQIAIDRIKKSK
jgi:hypothetical protein